MFDNIVSQRVLERVASEVEDERSEFRVNVIKQLQNIRKKRTADLRLAQVGFEQAKDRLKKAQQELKASEAMYHSAQHRVHAVKSTASSQISTLENKLRNSALPIISVFIDEMQAEGDKLASGGCATDIRKTANGTREVWSAETSLTLRMTAIQQAIAEAERLKLEILDADEIGDRTNALRAGLPEVQLEQLG